MLWDHPYTLKADAMPIVPIRPLDPETELTAQRIMHILPAVQELSYYRYLDRDAFKASASALGQLDHDTSARHLHWDNTTDLDDPLVVDLDLLDPDTAVLHVTGHPDELEDVLMLLANRVPRTPSSIA